MLDQPDTHTTAHRIDSDGEAIAVARALAPELAAGAARRDRERILPRAELDRISQAGLLGITVPRDFGGAGVSAVTLAEVTAILCEADGSLGQIPQNHFYILEAIRLDGTPAQQAFWFGRVLAGERIGNALAEIGTRTHTDFRTTLLADGNDFRLDGRKFYSTGALFAHWIAAVAKDEQGRRVLALIPRDTPGLTLVDDWSAFGQRTTGSGTTIFENVRVPAASVIPHYRTFQRPTPMGARAQIIHAAIDLGIARAAVREALAAPSSDPALISLAGDLAIRLHAADAMIRRAGWAVDTATADPTLATVTAASIAVAEAKVVATEIAIAAGNAMFELCGEESTDSALGLDRFWRDARTHTLHDPVRWKLHAIGNWVLNDVPPPRHGAI